MSGSEVLVKPSREEMFIAAAETIDAWGKVEWETMLLFGNLAGIQGVNRAWAIFHTPSGFRTQARMMETLASLVLSEAKAALVIDIAGKANAAANRRNAIVHGQWRNEEALRNGVIVRKVMFRDYITPSSPLGTTVKSWRELLSLKGIKRFYLDDQRNAKRGYLALSVRIMAVDAATLLDGQGDHGRPGNRFHPHDES